GGDRPASGGGPEPRASPAWTGAEPRHLVPVGALDTLEGRRGASMLTRRRFLSTGLATGAVLALDARARAIRRAPSDEVRVAVVGMRGRGHDHIEGLRKLPGVRIVALCDVDSDVLERERTRLGAPDIGLDVKGYRDLRKLLDEVELD